MSKKLPLLLFSSLCLLLPAALKAEDPFSSFTGRVMGNKVRLRTQPNLESHVYRDTSQGELFAITGEENEFYAIQPPKGTKGYVFRTFVFDGQVEGERVNIRLYPDIEAPIIGRLNSGERIDAVPSTVNHKWLEIDLPESTHFFIAKEYVDHIGPVEMLAQLEERKSEAVHRLNAAFLFARSEIQKPFEEIDVERVNQQFEELVTKYSDLPDLVAQAQEAKCVVQETFVQKKIAFLEQKANQTYAAHPLNPAQAQRMAQLGQELKQSESGHVGKVGEAASTTMGLASAAKDPLITDKMQVWAPLEESLYHLWLASQGNQEEGMEAFYADEELSAIVLTGIVEPFNRPVKNKPGDYLLRCDDRPVAFLYSTQVNLQDKIGKEVTLMGSPRPNNNFAFPAYFILSAE